MRPTFPPPLGRLAEAAAGLEAGRSETAVSGVDCEEIALAEENEEPVS